ncbi:hypothetical protein [Halobaculum limi]|uniref:hypothetical protein n=1 Tax=Halobaculum limi TaxID=3031916 RepID=UPI0024066A32|nr:hypothetical protein [Halobaculum sp. YSMS11]
MVTDSSRDRRVTLAVVGLVLAVAAAVAILWFVAATGGSADTDPMRAVEWELDRVNDSFVAVVHVEGPRIPTERLRVTVDGVTRRVNWSNEPLAAGGRGVVRADRGSRVTLLWERTRVDLVVLARWTAE